MRDVGEGTTVNEGRVVFQGLHQVRHESIFEQNRHRTGCIDIAGVHRLLVTSVADHDVTNATGQIVQIGGKTENSHDFRGDGDVEAAFARGTVARSAETDGDVAQGTVVHIHDTLPGDATWIQT